MLEASNKKEIREKLDKIYEFLDTDANDDWYIYESLHDKLQELETILKQNEVI